MSSTTETVTTPEVVFIHNQSRASTIWSKSNSHEREETNIVTEEQSSNLTNPEASPREIPDTILCVLWKNYKIGAAYYKISESQLYVVNESSDPPPHYPVTRSLFKEVNPLHTITIGGFADNFVKFLTDIHSEEDITVSSDAARNIPPEMSLLFYKEYTPEVCKNAVLDIDLPFLPDEPNDTEKEVHLHSLINFDYKISTVALGALLKFLAKNWKQFTNSTDTLRFLHINQISLENRVLMDWNTFKALQVFKMNSHDARFKRGASSSSREGQSIFKLFSSHCESQLGSVTLRHVLLNPVKDIDELNKRLDFIEFALCPSNKGFIESLRDNIKEMKHVDNILKKIQHARASVKNWENLYKTIYHMINIHEFCSKYNKLSIFREVDMSITPELHHLVETISNAIDFTKTGNRLRPEIKFGLDSDLDAKKLRVQDMSKIVTAAAQLAIDQLPFHIGECSVAYIKDMGHLIAVKEWEPNCDGEELNSAGLQFMFSLHGFLYYKSSMCVELDKKQGSIHTDIIAHENRIIQRISDFVVRNNKCIRQPLNLVALLDCLIAMSCVAEQYNYIRPRLTEDNTHEIIECRHPLLENFCDKFEPNDYSSGGAHGRMKLLTGPNGSGKSVYLKQVALVVYLAHVGSFVPARKASISMVHSIHSRMHASESAAIRLSAFMIDLSQMSQALHGAKMSSLVTIDEFGRGTTGSEGMGLLVGALKTFLNAGDNCPHILVSTHMQRIINHLPPTKMHLVECLKMESTKCDKNLVFMFKVAKGISQSYALDVAEMVGLDDDIIARAREILSCLQNNTPLRPVPNSRSSTADNSFVLHIPTPDD